MVKRESKALRRKRLLEQADRGLQSDGKKFRKGAGRLLEALRAHPKAELFTVSVEGKGGDGKEYLAEFEVFFPRGAQIIGVSSRKVESAKCLKCGCTDTRPCPQGCAWIWVDRKRKTGLCSGCASNRRGRSKKKRRSRK